MDIRVAEKRLADFEIISSIMEKHEKVWDCSWEEYRSDLRTKFMAPQTVTLVAADGGVATGFMMVLVTRGINHEAVILCSNVLEGAGFKECMRALGSAVLRWLGDSDIRRIRWSAPSGEAAWTKVLAPIATDEFPESGLKATTVMTWEKRYV